MYAPLPANSQLPSERNLAKSYLWAKASLMAANNADEQQLAGKLLAKILRIMPQMWVDSLDKKVNQHLPQLGSR
ncbi:hypothetical protein [Dasania marina]|uniref:hypothetical protein n=1 Tax=Dasania marina TaxID=471499 RepID=UPI0030DB429A|tara:strand:- start:27878 stop:28099 length:222 start_codon:yes stop_codon:yes gene_type:complete